MQSITVQSHFVRKRNCLLLSANFSDLFVDYYVHLMEYALRYQPEPDLSLKQCMALCCLHIASRPIPENHAWTIYSREQQCNFFVAGGSLQQQMVGRLFTENIKEQPHSLLYSQIQHPNKPLHNSCVDISGSDPLLWVEQFYTGSEQRRARAFELSDDRFYLLVAQPQADLEWLEQVSAQTIDKLQETEELRLLETRDFAFNCGCSLQKIMPALRGWKDRLDELFGEDEKLEVTCPRCNATYYVTREDFDSLS